MGFLAVPLAIAGSIASVGGSVIGAIGARNQAGFEQDIAEQNAVISRRQAAAEADRLSRDNRRRVGTTRAKMGASGLLSEGSFDDVLADAAIATTIDESLLRYGGELKGRQFDANAAAAGHRKSLAPIAGVANVGTSLLGAASTFNSIGAL